MLWQKVFFWFVIVPILALIVINVAIRFLVVLIIPIALICEPIERYFQSHNFLVMAGRWTGRTLYRYRNRHWIT
jgi:hypothetical protein